MKRSLCSSCRHPYGQLVAWQTGCPGCWTRLNKRPPTEMELEALILSIVPEDEFVVGNDVVALTGLSRFVVWPAILELQRTRKLEFAPNMFRGSPVRLRRVVPS